MSSDSPTHARAARFPIRLPLRFRPSGSDVWFPGRTENISCSGVLFRCRRSLPAHAPIQVVLALPAELTGAVPVKVVCTAYVSRTMPPQRSGGRLAIAAAFREVRPIRDEAFERSTVPRVPGSTNRRRETLHTLNNQLMVIVGNCDLLLMRESLDDDVRRGLLQMVEAVRRAAEAMRDL